MFISITLHLHALQFSTQLSRMEIQRGAERFFFCNTIHPALHKVVIRLIIYANINFESNYSRSLRQTASLALAYHIDVDCSTLLLEPALLLLFGCLFILLLHVATPVAGCVDSRMNCLNKKK